jgi:hypothetical protein
MPNDSASKKPDRFLVGSLLTPLATFQRFLRDLAARDSLFLSFVVAEDSEQPRVDHAEHKQRHPNVLEYRPFPEAELRVPAVVMKEDDRTEHGQSHQREDLSFLIHASYGGGDDSGADVS